MDHQVFLYILVRNDLDSMSCGKAVAQGTHCANQAVFEGRQKKNVVPLIEQWESETGKGFGTCIVLGVTEVEMYQTIEQVSNAGHHAAITHDPTYPLRDGLKTHLIPLDTCGYCFGMKSVLQPFLDTFKLY